MGNEISNENSLSNRDRDYHSRAKKIKRLRNGMILAIIFGSLFVTSQLLNTANQNWYLLESQRLSIEYGNGDLTYEEYDNLRDNTTLTMYTNQWSISIFQVVARAGVFITFIFVIIGLISIVLDESFSKKMRRLALGLAGVMVLLILFPLFPALTTVTYIL